jgi:hypothetical protein
MNDTPSEGPYPEIRLNVQAAGNAQVFQAGIGDIHVNYNTHHHGSGGIAAGSHRLAVEKPPGWEYLLYADILTQSMHALQGKWLSFCYNHTTRATRYTDERSVVQYLNHAMNESVRIVESMAGWLSPTAQIHAFGPPGEPANPSVIEHNARGLCDLFGEWLDLAIELRSVAVPTRISRARELTLLLIEGPILDGQRFLQSIISQLEEIPDLIARRAPGQVININLTFKPKLDEDILKDHRNEFRKLRRG